MPDGEFVDALSKRHPARAGDIDMDEALRPRDLRDSDRSVDRDRGWARASQEKMIGPEGDGVGAVRQREQMTGSGKRDPIAGGHEASARFLRIKRVDRRVGK